MTIHKSQGQTLTEAVVDLGKSEKVAGCTFVATLRVRSITGVVFEPMTFDRLKAIGGKKNFEKKTQGGKVFKGASRPNYAETQQQVKKESLSYNDFKCSRLAVLAHY